MSPSPTGFANPFEGALPVARQSRFHGSRAKHGGAARALIEQSER
jgi:hypothetical protein